MELFIYTEAEYRIAWTDRHCTSARTQAYLYITQISPSSMLVVDLFPRI